MVSLWLVWLLSGEVQPMRVEWKVGELTREALIYKPAEASEGKSPVVFGFHGHGGNAQQAAKSFHLHQEWPQAVVVYMQGVPTPGKLTDPEGKRNGWQHGPGEQDDRDLKFFDAVLATLREKHQIDESRIYATGHSNGGGFTYLLWAQRGDVFAAVAPSAAVSRFVVSAKAKPVLHLAGENDALVKYDWQTRSMEAVKALNGCTKEGKEWAKGCLIYESKTGTPFVSFIHSGGHRYPSEAPGLIVKFFKEHEKKVTK